MPADRALAAGTKIRVCLAGSPTELEEESIAMSQPNFIPGERLANAFAFAVACHARQTRKGTGIPYLSHLMSVAALVMEYQGDEDQTIAALLHDTLEDHGSEAETPIREQFGERVLGMVQGCTDGIPDANGVKPAWESRKLAYLDHLDSAPEDTLLVSCCDKLHNARSIAADYQASGDAVFDRFTASREQTIWYYRSLLRKFNERGLPADLLRELGLAVGRFDRA